MATSVFYNRVNVMGIPCFKSENITQSATAVTFGFGSPAFVERNFSGLIALKVVQAAEATAAALPVFFSMAGDSLPLVGEDGTQVVGADVLTRVYLVFYDRESNTLQLIG